jgi:hypothetical protein
VMSSPSGIDCGARCEADFPNSEVVTLTATADPGSEFVGWTGCATVVAEECKITVTAATAVSATFNLSGSTGKEGKEGPSGREGPAGPIGATGPAGPVGASGGNGAQGDAGPGGANGVAGEKGANGSNGAQGPAGKEGPAGRVQVVVCKRVGKKQKCTTMMAR